MELYPAIDLRDGRCVRLYQGDYDQRDRVRRRPRRRGRRCSPRRGQPWIHVVDLDAARTGEPVNRPVIAAIAAAVDTRSRPAAASATTRRPTALLERRRRPGGGRHRGARAARAGLAAGRARSPGRSRSGSTCGARGRGAGVGRGRRAVVLDVAAELADAGFAALIVTQIDVTVPEPVLTSSSYGACSSRWTPTSSRRAASARSTTSARSPRSTSTEAGLAGAIVGRALYDGHHHRRRAAAAVAATTAD